MVLKQTEENRKKLAEEEDAKMKAKQEKERILELSRIARKIQEKLR